MRVLVCLIGLLVAVVGCRKEATSSSSSSASSADDGCPSDISSSSVGKSCSNDGKICSGSGSAVRMLQCSRGKWVELEAPPPPPPRPLTGSGS